MKLAFEPEHLALMAQIREIYNPDRPIYLVGGAVRDALLGKPLHDMDFVMEENPTSLARELAKHLKVGFFILDDERHTARVVYYDSEGKYFPLDFVQFTGQNIEEDLRNRDFTINAMAVPVNQVTRVIDPLGGQADLEMGLLRLCNERSLLDDPVRVLRGVRLAVQFDLKFDAGLEQALQEAGTRLSRTTSERQRDEFFRLLAGPNPAKALELCLRLHIFDTLFPVLAEKVPDSAALQRPSVNQVIKIVERYDALLQVLTSAGDDLQDADWLMRTARDVLGQFSSEIGTYFSAELTPGRPKAALAYLGMLLSQLELSSASDHSQGQQEVEYALDDGELVYETCKQFSLSNVESRWVQTFAQHHQQLLPRITACDAPDRRTIFCFFKQTKEVGVALAIHALAQLLVADGADLVQEVWRCALKAVETYLSAWWKGHDELIAPRLFLDGNDLQKEFGLTPGKLIGDLLTNLEEEQASGIIRSPDQARNYVRNWLSELPERGENHES